MDHSTPGSALRDTLNGQTRISALTLDSEGRLWVANPNESTAYLHVRQSDGTWQSFADAGVGNAVPRDLTVDNNGQIWIILGNNIRIFDPLEDQERLLAPSSRESNIPGSRVLSFALDLEGQMWVGTNEGVTVFPSTFDILNRGSAVTPIFEQRPLLRNESINTIAIDGGNRKWIGTPNGLWLFSADGSELVHHFTEDNSPLISNQILDLAIDPRSGEVFIATDEGILSYRGTATVGTRTHQNVKVFPNPVRPDFDGLVGISGLVEGANVKITDASGRLFYETRAEGGTAAWDLRDYNGVRAATGVYLIFSTNFDGTETLATKVAIIE
ncbi:MAG: hypothetical protein HC880_04400 [Bacteroidia bacterium]|nr:hypothetical protein [Bacteroidia bacterium]